MTTNPENPAVESPAARWAFTGWTWLGADGATGGGAASFDRARERLGVMEKYEREKGDIETSFGGFAGALVCGARRVPLRLIGVRYGSYRDVKIAFRLLVDGKAVRDGSEPLAHGCWYKTLGRLAGYAELHVQAPVSQEAPLAAWFKGISPDGTQRAAFATGRDDFWSEILAVDAVDSKGYDYDPDRWVWRAEIPGGAKDEVAAYWEEGTLVFPGGRGIPAMKISGIDYGDADYTVEEILDHARRIITNYGPKDLRIAVKNRVADLGGKLLLSFDADVSPPASAPSVAAPPVVDGVVVPGVEHLDLPCWPELVTSPGARVDVLGRVPPTLTYRELITTIGLTAGQTPVMLAPFVETPSATNKTGLSKRRLPKIRFMPAVIAAAKEPPPVDPLHNMSRITTATLNSLAWARWKHAGATFVRINGYTHRVDSTAGDVIRWLLTTYPGLSDGYGRIFPEARFPDGRVESIQVEIDPVVFRFVREKMAAEAAILESARMTKILEDTENQESTEEPDMTTPAATIPPKAADPGVPATAPTGVLGASPTAFELIKLGGEAGVASAALEIAAKRLIMRAGGDPDNAGVVHIAKFAIVLFGRQAAVPMLGDKIPSREFVERRLDNALVGVTATASYDLTHGLIDVIKPFVELVGSFDLSSMFGNVDAEKAKLDVELGDYRERIKREREAAARGESRTA